MFNINKRKTFTAEGLTGSENTATSRMVGITPERAESRKKTSGQWSFTDANTSSCAVQGNEAHESMFSHYELII